MVPPDSGSLQLGRGSFLGENVSLSLLPILMLSFYPLLWRLCSLIEQNSISPLIVPDIVEQQSPTFLAPGTGFMEDSFSMDRVGGIFQVVMRAMVQVVTRAMGSGRWHFACSPTTHLLLCGRFLTDRGPVRTLEAGDPSCRECIPIDTLNYVLWTVMEYHRFKSLIIANLKHV